MQLDAKKILEPKRFILYEGRDNTLLVPIINDLIYKNNLKICDVGGASGKFLNEVIQKSNYNIKATILEIEDYYKDKLVNKKIEFIKTSILENRIDDNYFDIIVFRHLLHHLVSSSIRKTIGIQKYALDEIFRIAKKGAYVVFIEQINQISLFSRIVYIISKITNYLKIKIKYFNTGTVIVYFLSQKKIRKYLELLMQKYNLEIKKEIYFSISLHLKWKLSILMSRVGSVFYVIKVKK